MSDKTPYQGMTCHFISGGGVDFVGVVGEGSFPGWIRLKEAAQTQIIRNENGQVGVNITKVSGKNDQYRGHIDLNVNHFQQIRVVNTDSELYTTYRKVVTGLHIPTGRQVAEVARV